MDAPLSRGDWQAPPSQGRRAVVGFDCERHVTTPLRVLSIAVGGPRSGSAHLGLNDVPHPRTISNVHNNSLVQKHPRHLHSGWEAPAAA